MGKGTIVSGGEDGLYTVQKKLLRTRVDAAITRLDNNIAALNAIISNPETTEEEKKSLYARLAALESRKRILENFFYVPEDENISVWCADLTEDLSGDVGLAVIAYQDDIGVNILPGYTSGTGASPAAYDSDRDGQFGVGLSTTAFGAYYSWALFPLCQIWRPRYRYGEITEIDYDEDTCSVYLETVISRAQRMDVTVPEDRPLILENVPIEYMLCDAWAFDQGDAVLVKFENYDWERPKVIGFKDRPRICYHKGVFITEAPRFISGGWSYIALELNASNPCDPKGGAGPKQIQTPVSMEGFIGWNFESPITEAVRDYYRGQTITCNGVVYDRSIRYAMLNEGCHYMPAGGFFGSIAVMPGTVAKLYTMSGCVGEPAATIEGGRNGKLIWYDWYGPNGLETKVCHCRYPVGYSGNFICRDYSYDFCTEDLLSAAMTQFTGKISEFFTDGPELESPISDRILSVRVE